MEGKPDSIPDPFDTRKAKGSINFRYYELTELLALIDRAKDEGWDTETDGIEETSIAIFDWDLITSARRKITKKARDIEKRFETTKGDADGVVEADPGLG